MKTTIKRTGLITGLLIGAMISLQPTLSAAQRMGHRGGGGGGGRSEFSKPAGRSGSSINGGSSRSATRDMQSSNPSMQDRKTSRGNTGNKAATGNRTNVQGGNKTNINNKNVNINNSKNVNVNVNRTTVVRPAPRPYPRPPYHYGGFSYYSYHPYYYHPYRPFVWGPVWHPVGFFITTLAVTAVIVTVANQQYHYDQGVYYVYANGGYTVVPAPVGATITTLPPGSQTVVINETTNNYYYGGTYYEQSSKGYTVVPPTAGSVVENLPDGGQEVKIGDVTYVKIGDTYYQPIEQNGKSMYEVVEVKEGT